MISTRHRFIFIHVPKTAGNSVQEILLPFSDDVKTQTAHQDGTERFGLSGAVTKRKHAMLRDYEDALGPEALSSYAKFCVVRNPWERALSHYFSPHRWMAQTASGFAPVSPVWDEEQFLSLLGELKPACHYMSDRSGAYRADFVLRFETLAEDFAQAHARLGLPGPAALPHRNRRADSYSLALYENSPLLADAVAEAMADDVARFGYAPPAA